MSLQVWLPFNGSLTNQGLLCPQITQSASSYNSGKITPSSLAITNNCPLYFPYTPTTKTLSIAMWVNPQSPSAWCDIFTFGGTAQNRLEKNDSNIYYWFSVTESALIASGTELFSLPNQQWSHIAMIADDINITFYINGIKTIVVPQAHSLQEAMGVNNNFILGARSISGNMTYLSRINDLRIYDHCLSPREVKLLAQGLVAHYKLEHDAPNLLINANQYTSSKPLTKTSSSKDGWEATDMYCQVIPGETYYLSCETDGQWHDHSNANSGASPSNRYVTLWFYLTEEYSPNNTGYDKAICLTKTMRNNGKWTYTIPAGYNGLRIRTNLYSDGNPLTVKFWNFHLSKASHISQGYDCSGYGNHGTCPAALEPISDTPRYKNATKFNGNTNHRITYASTAFNFTDNFSWSCWVKHNYTGWDKSGASYAFTVGRADTGGFGYGLQEISATSMDIRFGSSNYTISIDENWHHVAFTKAGNTIVTYVDGTPTNYTFSGTLPTYSDGSGLGLGHFYFSGGSIYPYYGALSDFRIYATALSAAAVKELYQSSISFLDSGTLQCSEIVESPTNLKYNQNGTIQAKAIGELGYSGLMKHMVLNDGSTWARIHWLDVSSKNEYFANAAEANYCINKDNRFSLMQYMPHFKSNNNQYELLLTYPNLTAELPSGYTALQYIQTTGTQYIRTGVYGYSDGTYVRGHRWEMDIEFEANGIRQLMGYGPYGYEYWGVSADNTYEGMTVAAGERNLIVHDYSAGTAGGNKLWVNNSYRDVASNLETSYEYSLFNLYYSGNAAYFCYCKLYRCKAISYNNSIVRDFIPAKRNSDGVIGLYDLITGTFYTNSGSGSFIGGPIQSSHTPFLKFNRWIQNDWTNDVDQGENIVFRPLSTSWPAHNGPIKPANSYTQTVYDCDHKNTGNWWAPIGLLSTNTWGGGIPAASGDTQYETELWVRIDNLPKLTKLSMLDNAIQAFQIYEL